MTGSRRRSRSLGGWATTPRPGGGAVSVRARQRKRSLCRLSAAGSGQPHPAHCLDATPQPAPPAAWASVRPPLAAPCGLDVPPVCAASVSNKGPTEPHAASRTPRQILRDAGHVRVTDEVQEVKRTTRICVWWGQATGPPVRTPATLLCGRPMSSTMFAVLQDESADAHDVVAPLRPKWQYTFSNARSSESVLATMQRRSRNASRQYSVKVRVVIREVVRSAPGRRFHGDRSCAELLHRPLHGRREPWCRWRGRLSRRGRGERPASPTQCQSLAILCRKAHIGLPK